MPRLLHQLALAAALLFAGTAAANETAIRKALEPKLGSARIEGVQPAPMPGLWEVRVRTAADGVQLVYTDANGGYLIQGNLHDLRANRNLTEDRMRRLNAIKVESLPLDQAVKIQRGDGRRMLVMFSDPYCPYCQKFEETLLKVDDITVYVFMYPVIRPQNADHSKAVWCSPDRAKAWLDLALQHKRPAAAATCDNPVEKNLDLGRSLRVNSTPTLIFANGEKVSGGMSGPDLVKLLDESAKTAKKSQ
jgi:thiol:disulfide interchange protein DsbC